MTGTLTPFRSSASTTPLEKLLTSLRSEGHEVTKAYHDGHGFTDIEVETLKCGPVTLQHEFGYGNPHKGRMRVWMWTPRPKEIDPALLFAPETVAAIRSYAPTF